MKIGKYIMGASLALCLAIAPAMADKLVILHTNDTHSNIDPSAGGAGGILQRKAIMDSVKKAEKNVIAVDAGDAVQGSLYFKYFRGDVEYPLMDMSGYDIRILGNHEFDNGLDELASRWQQVKGDRLSANYDFTGTPAEGIFQPWTIKHVGDKNIGFIGINVDPESLIAYSSYPGMKFLNVIETANSVAQYLREEKGCDLIVAVTHIGYETDLPGKTTDPELAAASKDIDIIIGGHSHTLIDPADPKGNPYLIPNAEGKPVLVTQTGKYGKYVGKIEVDMAHLTNKDASRFKYSLIPVTDRFPEESLDKEMREFLLPYREKVDSVNHRVIGKSARHLVNSDRNGGFGNFAADFAMWYGNMKADSLSATGNATHRPDMAIMNIGGIRQEMPEGDVTEGQILSTFPFSNHMTLIAVSGADIIEALRVAAQKGGEAISGNVRVVTDSDCGVRRVVINDEVMEPEKTYHVMTIDYVAEGNDGLRTLANHKNIWRDDIEMCAPMLRYLDHLRSLGLPVAPDPTGRFVEEISIP